MRRSLHIISSVAPTSGGASVSVPGLTSYHELPAWYGLAECFIHASTAEQWGLVVNEAMAAAAPVLVSNRCGCATDLVREGVNGYTFDPCDVAALADLMLRCHREQPLLPKMGAAARETISAWSPARFACQLRAAAEAALAAGPSRASAFDRALLAVLAK